jgi:glyoxylase-like metal-dependent hydrolase (beta-lactamase superfamily II)
MLEAMWLLEQWLAGRDFARANPQAAQMLNFVYLVADPGTGRAWLVDPAWDAEGLVARVERGGFRLAGVLLTHWHPDHAGGDLWGLHVEGAAEVRRATGVPVHAHAEEARWLSANAGLAAADLTLFHSDDVLALDGVRARCLHAPGHSPGGTCFLLEPPAAAGEQPPALLSGDVLFVGACGRVDLPGSDPGEMYRTLRERLAALPDETDLYPGHDYGARPTSTLGEERAHNAYLKFPDLESWLAEMG